jgi:hypothetical protein
MSIAGLGYRVLAKTSCQDFFPGGIELGDSIQVIFEVPKEFTDAIEVSGVTIV